MTIEPLTPERLTELERLAASATPGPLRWVNFAQPVVWFPRHTSDDEYNGVLVTDGELADPTTDTRYLLALWNAAPELLRVYRGASGNPGLAARMGREARIITLETEVGRLRGEYRRGLEDALAACSKTEDDLKRNYKLWGPDQAADESGGALGCQIAIEALIGAVDDA